MSRPGLFLSSPVSCKFSPFEKVPVCRGRGLWRRSSRFQSLTSSLLSHSSAFCFPAADGPLHCGDGCGKERNVRRGRWPFGLFAMLGSSLERTRRVSQERAVQMKASPSESHGSSSGLRVRKTQEEGPLCPFWAFVYVFDGEN